jgi:hypothetical protein
LETRKRTSVQIPTKKQDNTYSRKNIDNVIDALKIAVRAEISVAHRDKYDKSDVASWKNDADCRDAALDKACQANLISWQLLG